jgi:O-methyltransferase/demethyldecarbamoylnovobiocin O-methyltransferase/8-demethyl-8-(2,3-dimethoxy-alpha-L-rhamnosyl)tetracenomycin-C 4'-O-methyltransferase
MITVDQGRGTGLYLELFKKVLTNVIYQDSSLPNEFTPSTSYDQEVRAVGMDWPTVAHTMVGMKRLDNVHWCLDRVLADRVVGDFIETGVWRGGVCIFMRAFLLAHGCTTRRVWVADSFQGIPTATGESHPFDQEMALHQHNDVLGVTLEAVRENFRRYGLLDDQVEFVPGWFKDTLPVAPIDRLALLRLDGDLYESTMDALDNLYPKLSVGGFVIIDDYLIPSCREAVHDFRARFHIEDTIHPIDGIGVYWRRTRDRVEG